MTNQGKILTKLNPRYVMVFKILPWLVNRSLCLKIIKYQNVFFIFLLQYCMQIISSVCKPLKGCVFFYIFQHPRVLFVLLLSWRPFQLSPSNEMSFVVNIYVIKKTFELH